MIKFTYAVLILVGLSGAAEAAMFCTSVPGMRSECIYDDPASCRTRAAELGGVCTLNPDQAMIAPGYGYGSFCMVDASHMSICAYSDRNSCESDAARNRSAICVENNRYGTPNPFQYVPRRAY